MAKRPTVYDVAEAAGVSIATVSLAFRRPAKLRPATVEVVHTTARRLGYVPSASARGLAAGRTGVLGLISWDLFASTPANSDMFSNSTLRDFPRYVDEVQRGVEIASWRNGYALLVGGGNHRNSEAMIIDIAGRTDGLVVLPHTMGAETLIPISERVPVVIVSEFEGTENLNRVIIDNDGGMRKLVEHLVEEHHARKFVFVGNTDSVEYGARWNAFCSTLVENELQPPSAPLPGPDSVAAGLHDDSRTAELPDAFVCRNDADALNLIDALRERGIRVPEDVIVTGFDGIAAGLVSEPTLTTVRQPMQALGETAIEVLMLQLNGSTVPETRYLPTRFEARSSCGCRE